LRTGAVLIGEVADEASGRQRLGASAKEDALLSQENAFGHGTDRIGEVSDEVSGRQRLGASAEEDALLSQENAFGHVTGRIGEVTDEAAVRQKLGASAKEDALLSQENAFGHGIGGIGEVSDEVSGRQRLGASGQENAFGHGTGRIGEVADEAAVRQKLGASGQENAFGHGTDRTAGQRSMENRDTRMQTTKMDDDDKTKPLGKFDDLNMDPAKMSTGERILSSMQSISEASASSKFAAETIVKISSEIANRILISNAALDAKQEVRVQLKNDILPGTEIFIAKDGPKLNVQFNVAVSESAFFLMGRQGELRQHLIDNLKEITFVEINIKDDSQPNDTRKDGRSKNQRQYENQEEMGNFDE
ncbi:MAG: hypothetical protein LBH49_00925, partial [Puniceicoccales bacterium]|nr:hypothetical protein [Puniceicoccales bacterium]